MINKNLLWSTYFIAWRKIYIARIKHNKKNVPLIQKKYKN
jgi:hypothetical protein